MKLNTRNRKEMQQQITDRVVSELEQGTAPWIKRWGTGLAGLPHNGLSRRRYNGINVLLLMWEAAAKGYTSNQWFTLNQISKSGAWINTPKEFTTIVFFEPVVKNKGGDEEYTYWFMKTHRVYNWDQLTTKPSKFYKELEPMGKANPNELDPMFMNQIYTHMPEIVHGGDMACYSLKEDKIRMPRVEDFHNEAHYQATLAHEMVHWTGAKHRLKRFEKSLPSRKDYAFEELIAEMGAAFLIAEYGIDHDDLRHAGYIESWIKLLKDDSTAFTRACTAASKAVEFIYPDPARENTDFEKKETAAA